MSESRTARWLVTAIVAVVLASYAMSLCRTVYWGDGIELTSVAAVLGVAHPTGYPLFSLLGKTFAQLPLGTVAFRLNLMSAATGAALAALVAGLVWSLLPLLGLIEAHRTAARACLAAAAALTVAFSRTFWYQAALTEVYLLSATILAGVLLLLLRAVAEQDWRWFLAAVFLSALGLGNHMMTIMLIPALIALGVWLIIEPRLSGDGRRKKHAGPHVTSFRERLMRLAGPALLLALVGVTVYIYLPLRAAKNPPLNWGDPSTLPRFCWVVRGGEFRRFRLLQLAPGVPFDRRTYPPFLGHRAASYLGWTADQLLALPEDQSSLRVAVGFLLLFVAGIGWWAIARRRAILAIVLLLAVLFDALAVAVYNIPDIEGYFLPAHLIVIICGFVALTQLLRWAENRLLATRSDLLMAWLLLIPSAAWAQNRTLSDHSAYDAAERYGRQALDRLPGNAMILTQGDYDIYSLWYQQVVERRRRDVVVMGSNFLATPGYSKYFEGRYEPPVAAPRWDRTPESKEIYYQLLVRDVILPNLSKHPLYSTWYDPLMGVQAQPIEIPVIREENVLDVPERAHFPGPFIYRLQQVGKKP